MLNFNKFNKKVKDAETYKILNHLEKKANRSAKMFCMDIGHPHTDLLPFTNYSHASFKIAIKLNNQIRCCLLIVGLRQFHSVQVVGPRIVRAKKLTNSVEGTLHRFVLTNGAEESSAVEMVNKAELVPPITLLYGQWVLVKYIGETSAKYYIGQVVAAGDETKVKFVRRSNKGAMNNFYWPDDDDVDTVLKENVVRNVAEPQTDRRGRLSFTDHDEIIEQYIIQ
jgi:hypothetical protein